jgi:signal transduction histidine kinase
MEAILSNVVPRYFSSRRLLGYVAGVVLVGLALAVWRTWPEGRILSWSFLLWLVINIVAELLWLETISGDSTDSMASAANFAVIFLLAPGLCLWIIGISVFLATRFIQKRNWIKTFFGFGQMVITTYLALLTFHLIHPGPVTLESLRSLRTEGAMVASGLTYFFVNTWLVAGAVSLDRKTPFWSAWRQNYAYRNSVVTALALFSLSPLLVLSFLSLGYPGVLLFFVPLLIIKNQNKEYIDLQKMTKALISSERFAAKGEMAAEVAHEINNYLAVLSARAQLIQMRAGKGGDEKLKADAEIIFQQVQRMNTLAKGLLGFSHRGIRIQSLDCNRLVADTVEFVRPQNLFDGVDLMVQLDPEVGLVEADGGQLQQVLINLLRNAAQAMGEAKGPIQIRTSNGKRGLVRISVKDSGPGIPPEIQGKVFEPGRTTKPDGHGFGLATCYRILENHGGRIWVESEPGQGAHFLMEFPKRAEGEKDGGRQSKGENQASAPEEGPAERRTGTGGL